MLSDTRMYTKSLQSVNVSVTVNHQFVTSSYGASLLTSKNVLAPRVLYCTDTYPPQVNGVSIVTARTAAGLRARGWKVGVIAPRYPRRPRHGVRQFVDEVETADLHVEG